MSSKQRTTATVSTPLLWDAALSQALHTGWPPPGYDPQHERRVMQQYYKAVADEYAYRVRQRQHQRAGGVSCR